MTRRVHVHWQVRPESRTSGESDSTPPPPRVRIQRDDRPAACVALPRWPLLGSEGGTPLWELLEAAYREAGPGYPGACPRT